MLDERGVYLPLVNVQPQVSVRLRVRVAEVIAAASSRDPADEAPAPP